MGIDYRARVVILDELVIVEYDYDSSVLIGNETAFTDNMDILEKIMFTDKYPISEIIFL